MKHGLSVPNAPDGAFERGTTISALVGVIMGFKPNWSILSHTMDMPDKPGIPYEVKVISAHRAPDLLF